MLNNSGESGHPSHVPDDRGKALYLSPLSVNVSYGFFVKIIFMLRKFPFSPSLLLQNNTVDRVLDFVKCLFYVN